MKGTVDFGLLSGLAAFVLLDTPRLREHVWTVEAGLRCATGEHQSERAPQVTESL